MTRWIENTVLWLGRIYLSIAALVSGSDIVGFLSAPKRYPIGTEIDDPRYASAARFLTTAGNDFALALIGLVFSVYFAHRGQPRSAIWVALIGCTLILLSNGVRVLCAS
jgi:hypothetical protein